MALLEVDDLHAGYGRIEVLHGVSLRLEAHSLCAIVGANGAGKSTLLLTLSRLITARSGTVRFDGRDLTRAPSDAVVRAGLVHVPEGRRVLASMSVDENMLVAAAASGARRAEIDALYERFPILGTRRAVPAGSLSGGEQQMLAIARGLAMKPKALLLDEPSMGLSPIMVEKIFEVVRSVSAQNIPILLVEQNARLALESAHRAYVMDSGIITLSGDAKDMLHDPKVREAYLGEAGA